MKSNRTDNLDKLTRKIMKASSLETPSDDFTNNVISGIEIDRQIDITTYQPLISKAGWMVIAAILIVMIGYSFSFDAEWHSWLNLNWNSLSLFSSEEVSRSFMYGVLNFTLLFILQIPLIKYILNKRLQA